MFMQLLATDGEGDSGTDVSAETDVGTDASNDVEGPEHVSDTPQSIEIDGEQYTLEQLKEFRQGYMRQSDYTRKTQEIANMRKEAEDAVELYEYLRANPQVAQRLAEVEDPSVSQRADEFTLDPTVQELSLKIHTMEIDQQLNAIKSKDPNADEIRILELAAENGVDVSKAYQMWRGENFDTILKKELDAYGKNITEKIQKNGQMTSTMINTNDGTANNTHGLSDIELAMCKKLDMTPAEYSKYKDYKR